MKKIYFLFLFLTVTKISFACLNGETKELENGFIIYEDYEGSIPYGHRFYLHNADKLKSELDSLYKTTNKIEYLSDKGYVLIAEGKFKEALNLYLQIEKSHPNRYSTASNIGTIYELLGENEKALYWIKKSISINPSSHDESEWIHVKILEAKLKGREYYNSKFLLDVDFGTYSFPISTLSESKLYRLEHSLYYQLNERISFIKDKDEIIANLLFELGNIAMLRKEFHDAEQLFKMSKEYGNTNELVNIRLAYLDGFKASKVNLFKKNNPIIYKYNYVKTTLLVLSILIFIVMLLYIIRLRRK